MDLGLQKERYRTVKGWSGKKYRVRMTDAEIQVRERIGLCVAVCLITPAMVFLMALVAGMI